MATTVKSCKRAFAKVVLKPDPDGPLADAFELKLFAIQDADWWKNLERAKDTATINTDVLLGIDSNDLRLRYLPGQGSSLKLFGKTIKVNQWSKDLKVRVNASVRIYKKLYWDNDPEESGFEAYIRSGSVVFENLDSTFYPDWKQWLWQGEGKELSLFLGKDKVQMKVDPNLLKAPKDVGTKGEKESQNPKGPQKPKEKELASLYEYVGPISKQSSDHLWKMVYFQHEKLKSLEDELEETRNVLSRIAESIGNKTIRIKPRPAALGVFIRIKSGQNETYFKPGVEIEIQNERLGSRGGGITQWIPNTVKKRVSEKGTKKYEHFQLLGYDEIGALISGSNASKAETKEYDLFVQWFSEQSDNERHRGKRKISSKSPDPTTLPGSSTAVPLYLSGVTNPKATHGKFLWQVAKEDKSDNTNQLTSWIRYELGLFGGSGGINPRTRQLGIQSKELGGSALTFFDFYRDIESLDENAAHWTIKVNLDDKSLGKEADLSGVLMEFTQEQGSEKPQGITLALSRPHLLAQSPRAHFYTSELKDPSSMPAVKDFTPGLELGSLTFESSFFPETKLVAKQALRLEIPTYDTTQQEDNILVFNDTAPIDEQASDSLEEPLADAKASTNHRGQLSYYENAPLAVIDRISASKNNLPTHLKPGINVYSFTHNAAGSTEENLPGKVTFKLVDGKIQVVLNSTTLETAKLLRECWLSVEKDKKLVFLGFVSFDKASNKFFVKKEKENALELSIENPTKEVEASNLNVLFNRLSVPRDPHHGFIAHPLKAIAPMYGDIGMVFKKLADTGRLIEKKPQSYSTEALMPWIECLFELQLSSIGTKRSFFHRNLVLEQMEIEVSREYEDINAKKTTYNASEAFIQATRDRYCLAAHNVSSRDKADLLNWMPGVTWEFEHNSQTHEINPKITYLESDTTRKFPEINLGWDEKKVGEKDTEFPHLEKQSLSIEPMNSHWLDFHIEPKGMGAPPRFKIEPSNGNEAPNSKYRTVNSYTPLVFEKDEGLYYDNLGTIRPVAIPTASKEGSYKAYVELIASYSKLNLDSAPQTVKTELFNVTIPSQKLIEEGGLAHETFGASGVSANVTQLYFTCTNLKVIKGTANSPDGVTVGNLPALGENYFFEEGFDLGTYGFSSHVQAPSSSLLSAVDNWPRYRGVPFYVTSIQKFSFDSENNPVSIDFDAVIASPEAINQNEKSGKIPSYVAHAVANGRVVHFKYTFAKGSASPGLKIVSSTGSESQFDWMLSLSDQLVRAKEAKMPGRLARLTGSVLEEKKEGKIELTVSTDSTSDARALIMGKMWPFKESSPLTVRSSTLFQKIPKSSEDLSTINSYIQTEYDFRSPHIAQRWSKMDFKGSYEEKSTSLDIRYNGAAPLPSLGFCKLSYVNSQGHLIVDETYYAVKITQDSEQKYTFSLSYPPQVKIKDGHKVACELHYRDDLHLSFSHYEAQSAIEIYSGNAEKNVGQQALPY